MSRRLRLILVELYRRIPYVAIFSLSLYVLINLATWSYYRFMPGSWFLDVQGTPHIADGNVSDTLTLTFCRSTRYPNISALGARSYYLVADNHKTAAGSYRFAPRFEQQDGCQYISVPPDKHPQKAGTYLAHTELTFKVRGHEKTVKYDTNTFRLTDTRQSLEDRIKELQRQIDDLLSQQQALPAFVEPVSGGSVSQPTTNPSTATNAQQTAPTSSTAPVDPTTPAAPEPDTRNFLERTLDRITNLL